MNNVEVGKFIKELIKSNNMTQDDLAEKLGISKSAVSQNINGKSSFELSNLMAIADLFNITLDQLVHARSEATEKSTSEFERAAKLGVKAVEGLKVKGVDLKKEDLYGKSLMDYALELDQIEVFEYLIKKEQYPIHKSLREKLGFINFLIKHEQVSLLELAYPMDPVEKKIGPFVTKGIRSYERIQFPEFNQPVKSFEELMSGETTLLSQYSPLEQEYIKTVIACKNEKILDLMPYFAAGLNPTLAIVAIELDDADFLRYAHEVKHKILDFSYLYYAIHKNSRACMEYLFANVDQSHGFDLSYIIGSEDLTLLRWVVAHKTIDRSNIDLLMKKAIGERKAELVQLLYPFSSEIDTLFIEAAKVGDTEFVKANKDLVEERFSAGKLNPKRKVNPIYEALVQAALVGNADILRELMPKATPDILNEALTYVKSDDMVTLKLLLENGACFVDSRNLPLEQLTNVIRFLLKNS